MSDLFILTLPEPRWGQHFHLDEYKPIEEVPFRKRRTWKPEEADAN